METLTPAQVLAMDGLDDWRVIDGTLWARFVTPDMSAGADFVTRIVTAANAMNHHPDLALSYARVDLMRHDGQWLLSELEVTEPGLYLDVVPGNAAEFVARVLAR